MPILLVETTELLLLSVAAAAPNSDPRTARRIAVIIGAGGKNPRPEGPPQRQRYFVSVFELV